MRYTRISADCHVDLCWLPPDLFVTNASADMRDRMPHVIERINAAGSPVVSVDLPSGVDASTGEVAGAAVDADLTVTFHAPKVGLAVAPGRFRAGRVVIADIGRQGLRAAHDALTSCHSEPPQDGRGIPCRSARPSQ